MFKSGDSALVLSTGQIVTVESIGLNGDCCVVSTSGGSFKEYELHQAHPSVVLTSEGRSQAREAADRARKEVCPNFNLSLETRDKLSKLIKGFDYNGHFESGASFDKGFNPIKGLFLSLDCMTAVDAEDLIRSAKSKKFTNWFPIRAYLGSSGLYRCNCCGKSEFELETNGKVLRISDPCEYPNGLPDTEWELNVPSGRLVVANDLRQLFPIADAEDADISTSYGCRQVALSYADNGLSHAFVGNTCPGLYKCHNGSYKIANKPSKERWDGKKYVTVKTPRFEGKRLAGICTNLWWYSICDKDEFDRRLKHFEQKEEDFNVEVVDVKPGVYRFTHFEGVDRDGPEEVVYSRFEWVRDPDPIMDFLASYQSADVNPNAYVHAMVSRWPTLYGKEVNYSSWASVANQVFCTLGSGVEWHEKGFPTAKVDPSIPDTYPPSFREQMSWYPFSKPYGGLYEPKTLTPSFAKLAFRVLESIISFGMQVHDGEHSRDTHGTRARMLEAVVRYRELADKYPAQADPEYVSWLSIPGVAEAWVDRFNLGPTFTEKHLEHAKQQRWVPEDTYAVEFDARKLNGAKHFTNGEYWSDKKNATMYAINEWHDNSVKDPVHNCCWYTHATNNSIPLYCVARVVKLGEVSHTGNTLVEIEFDYGTPWMLEASKRKALLELDEKDGIRVLSKDLYEKLLPLAKGFFEDSNTKKK